MRQTAKQSHFWIYFSYWVNIKMQKRGVLEVLCLQGGEFEVNTMIEMSSSGSIKHMCDAWSNMYPRAGLPGRQLTSKQLKKSKNVSST